MPRAALLRPKGWISLFGVAFGVASLLGAQAPQVAPSDLDRATARLVVELIERGHLSKPEVNDEISEKWFRLFLKTLDPQKLYFEKGDIAEFSAKAKNLDDEVRKGDLSFANLVFDRYLKRQEERLATIMELLKEPHDFNVDETIVNEPDNLDFPADAAEARERWRKYVKLELLRKKVAKVKPEDALKQLQVRFRDSNRYFKQFDMTDRLEVFLSALARAIDPHSLYMGPKTLDDFNKEELQLSLEGIGAQLGVEDGVPTIKEIVPGGAADKDGRLKVEDKVLGVEKEDGTTVDFVEKKLSDVVRVIRGPRGTKVKIIVQPNGSTERKTYEITREKIDLADQRARGEILDAKGTDGKPVKVGVINLPGFYGDTAAVRRGDPNAVSATKDVEKILKDFEAKGVDVVLLDLRRNGGGLLLEAISLSGLFIDSGPVVRVRDPEVVIPYDDDDKGTAYDGPLAVLISHYSASASEIFAGVIKDYGRGLVIGDSSTFGKGTVQQILDPRMWLRHPDGVPDLGALKLTIQQFYRANGESTQVQGVKPDVHIPSFADHFEDLGEGEQDNALKFDKIAPLPHDRYERVPADLVARLDKLSTDRRSANPKFQKQAEGIQKLIERQKRHEVPLNEVKFRAEFLSDEEDVEEAADEENAATKPDRKRDQIWDSDSFYNKEVIQIVADYVTLGGDVVKRPAVHANDIAANPSR